MTFISRAREITLCNKGKVRRSLSSNGLETAVRTAPAHRSTSGIIVNT